MGPEPCRAHTRCSIKDRDCPFQRRAESLKAHRRCSISLHRVNKRDCAAQILIKRSQVPELQPSPSGAFRPPLPRLPMSICNSVFYYFELSGLRDLALDVRRPRTVPALSLPNRPHAGCMGGKGSEVESILELVLILALPLTQCTSLLCA